jgi:hypothetical protein
MYESPNAVSPCQRKTDHLGRKSLAKAESAPGSARVPSLLSPWSLLSPFSVIGAALAPPDRRVLTPTVRLFGAKGRGERARSLPGATGLVADVRHLSTEFDSLCLME